jgi:VanZ family protein
VKTLVVEYWSPLLLWLLATFYFSTDTFASGQTYLLIVPLLTFFLPGLAPHHIEMCHAVIRKLGHVTEYFVLAAFAYRSLKNYVDTLVQLNVRAFMFVLAAALLDELHQAFTVSRGASIVDVGYDCLGAVWALWLITTYETRRLRSHPVL